MFLYLTFCLLSWTVTAQSDAYQKAIKEIEDQFGIVPAMFKVYPDYALPAAWENWRIMLSGESIIPAKYRELLQLAVASQIPCQYCIYFHTLMAKNAGATDEEIEDAVAQGAQTRHWSMILQGNQISFDDFKTELDNAMKNMATKEAQSSGKE